MKKAASTTVKVSVEVNELLKTAKEEGGHSSIDELLRSLLTEVPTDSDDSSSSSDESEGDEGGEKRRKIYVMPGLLTLEQMVERKGMLELYTGLTHPMFK